ncbi:MAG: amidohydrolase family protein [Nitrososphaerota archaeon]|nr:amidohydrolase family protein [Nitrososphaerota archaeon]
MVTEIENLSMLVGPEFQLIEKGRVEIVDGVIRSIEDRSNNPSVSSNKEPKVKLNGKGLLAIPGLINAHVHIGDSIAKDIGVGLPFNELVHPIYGLKTKILNEATREQISQSVTQTVQDMLAGGITTFADFREGGLEGVELVQSSLRDLRIRTVLLGRPSYHFSADEVSDGEKDLDESKVVELQKTLDLCNGVGLSGPNEYTSHAMKQISEIARTRKKLLAIHAAESTESRSFSLEHFGITEVARLLKYMKPDFLVHLTNSTNEEMRAITEANIPVVCCPRANSMLGIGFPPIVSLLQMGANVSLGTDNVMINSPDMFREMDYTSKMIRVVHRSPAIINSKDILKMATINASNALGVGSKIGSLEEGKLADIVFLDLKAANFSCSKDIVSSVVHRARSENVKCVMIGGEIVHGSIPKF